MIVNRSPVAFVTKLAPLMETYSTAETSDQNRAAARRAAGRGKEIYKHH